MLKELTWKKAIEKVLFESAKSMHYKEIAEQIVSMGLRVNIGTTPAAMVSASLTTSIKKLGEKSPFIKVGKGEYILRKFGAGKASVSSMSKGFDEDEKQYDITTSFGMFWRLKLVHWTPSPSLLGMQQIDAKPVDFTKQTGIYLLYDGREVIYVGRATDRLLGRRLYEHTIDRLSSRWDRFSWFGVQPVSAKGQLPVASQRLPSI